MSLTVFLPLILSLGICLVPVWLLRRPGSIRPSEEFVSSGYTAPEVIRNASIASGLRLAAIGPVVVLGARGDFWPVIIGAVCFGLGVFLLYLLRRPILEFLAGALAGERSVTVHAFIAGQHGGDAQVRRLAAGLTLFTLAVFIAAEAFALSGFFTLIFSNTTLARALTVAALLLALLYAVPAGHPGAMQATQLQLGMILLGLIGATALLLYLHLSALTPLPPRTVFAILFAAACCLAMLVYRRSRYVDAGPIGASRGAKLLSKFGKLFNPVVSVFVVTVIIFAGMEFSATGLSAVVTGSGVVLLGNTNVPAIGLLALALLPLFYPISDIALWQKLAAVQNNEKAYQGDTARWQTALRGISRIHAVESALLWLFLASLGAIAAAALALPDDANVIQAFVQALVSGDNEIVTAAFALLLVAVVAIALSTMISALSAALCTIHYDLSPATTEAGTASFAGRAFFAAIVVALALADVTLNFTSSHLLALLFALGSPVLSFVPLIVGPIFGRRVSTGWAMIILGVGAVIAMLDLGLYAATASDAWLWATVPACLLAGFALLAAGNGQGSRMR